MKPVIAIIEARMTSSRLPGKVLMPVGGMPLLQVLIERLGRAELLDGIVVATTVNAADDEIEALCERAGAGCFRGSEENVLERVCGAALRFGADTIVEITGDCPLVDPWQVDQAVEIFRNVYPRSRYVSNCTPIGNSPIGMNVQVFKAGDLIDILNDSPDEMDREHVSCRFYSEDREEKYRPTYISYDTPLDRPDIWVTLDYREDYELIQALYEDLITSNEKFGLPEVIDWIDRHPEMHRRGKELRSL